MKLVRLAFSCLALLLGESRANAENARSVVLMTLAQGENGGGRIYLPLRIGNFMGSMQFDTGASTSRITLAEWNKDMRPVGASASAGASGEATACEDVLAGVVELKASEGSNVARANYPMTRCAAGQGADLFGLDFFKGVRFSLDFQRREMVFFGSQIPPKRAKRMRLLGGGEHLVGLDVRLGKTSVVGLFDTGANFCAVDASFVAKHPALFTLVKGDAAWSDAGGKRFAGRKIYKIKDIDLGEGRKAHDVHALVYDFGALRQILGRGTPLILGYNLISGFDWSLDFTNPDPPKWDAQSR
jgi:hypothetical protein